MNIKSLLIFTSLSLSITSAADLSTLSNEIEELPSEVNTTSIGTFEKEHNSLNLDLKVLIQDYLLGAKSISDLNNYIKLLQIELYDLIDDGEIILAMARFEEIQKLLDPAYENMEAEDQLGAGLETLSMIEEYINLHQIT